MTDRAARRGRSGRHPPVTHGEPRTDRAAHLRDVLAIIAADRMAAGRLDESQTSTLAEFARAAQQRARPGSRRQVTYDGLAVRVRVTRGQRVHVYHVATGDEVVCVGWGGVVW